MCDPLTLGLAAVSGAAMLFSGGDEAAPPPPPPAVAQAPAKAREPDAEVRLGDGTKKTKASAAPAFDGFTEKRVAGKSLGGLGRGGLGL